MALPWWQHHIKLSPVLLPSHTTCMQGKDVTYGYRCQATCSMCWAHGWAVQNGWSDRDAIWGADSCGSKEPCIRWGTDLPRGTIEGEMYWPIVIVSNRTLHTKQAARAASMVSNSTNAKPLMSPVLLYLGKLTYTTWPHLANVFRTQSWFTPAGRHSWHHIHVHFIIQQQ